MEKVIAVVLGLAVLGFVAYKAIGGKTKQEEVQVPTQQLENVKKAATAIELKQNDAAEKALEKATAE